MGLLILLFLILMMICVWISWLWTLHSWRQCRSRFLFLFSIITNMYLTCTSPWWFQLKSAISWRHCLIIRLHHQHHFVHFGDGVLRGNLAAFAPWELCGLTRSQCPLGLTCLQSRWIICLSALWLLLDNYHSFAALLCWLIYLTQCTKCKIWTFFRVFLSIYWWFR